jgi:Uma2 family endonuclease
LNKRLVRLVPSGFEIRVQSAIRLPDSEPEPDLTLARGDDLTFAQQHPEPAEIVLLVEVADSTLTRDRQDKGRIYARSAIAEYWIVNLVDRQVEVYTQPSGPVAAPSFGHRRDYRTGDALPVNLDGKTIGSITVTEILM